jgi:hypothetical protein
VNSKQVALSNFRSRVLCICHAAVIGIFFAFDRRHMGWIFIKIRSPDSKILAVRVNPFPQTFACNESFRTGLAPCADKIGSKPVTVASPQASTMV